MVLCNCSQSMHHFRNKPVMNLRGSGGKSSLLAMAAGVGAAEGASILYFMFTPSFLSPGDRSLYTSAGFNTLMFMLMLRFVKKCYYLRTWQDALNFSVFLTLIYVCTSAPYVITWWNPMTYMYLIGPAAHTMLQITMLTVAMWYFKV